MRNNDKQTSINEHGSVNSVTLSDLLELHYHLQMLRLREASAAASPDDADPTES